jgi:hypothetical protein
MQAQQQSAMMEQQSKTVRNLGAAPVGDGNALEGILSNFSGYT